MDSKESILNSIKKLHGISPEDTSFDIDITLHINSALMILNQLGVGPTAGFYIEDASTTWDEYISDRLIVEPIKSFIYIKVRLIFDPPASATVVEALKSSADEYQWRIVQWAEQN